ncbi:MAG: hypothetical protein FJW83_02555 [Actinobacteria bacterium]|nr:hypothetical protein [Actinomycetota bacterium]
MGWADDAAPVEVSVACGPSIHRLRWSGGRVETCDHDLDAEEALVAFGGDVLPCVRLHRLWRDAVADGGFLEEWARRPEPDPVRRDWLAGALRRLRAEGVQDLLPALPPGRAERMGEVLVDLPAPLLDRAAVAAAARVLERRVAVGPPPPGLDAVVDAVRVRLRSAFVASLRRWAEVVRPAALVPLRCGVRPTAGGPPVVRGRLDGRTSGAHLVVDVSWLVDVWGRGIAVVDGDLVVAADDRHASVLRWRRHPAGGLIAEVEEVERVGTRRAHPYDVADHVDRTGT